MSCKCAAGVKNSGITSQQQLSAAVLKDVYVPLYKADGTLNFVDLTAELVNGILPEQFFKDQVAQDDPKDRWYPTPSEFVTVTPAQADPRAQTFAAGNIAIAGKGIKSVIYQLKSIEPVWGGKIEALSCDELGTYTVDECGGFEGVVLNADETKLYPKPINKDSFNIDSIPGDLSPAVELVNIAYQFKLTYKDKDRRYIPASAIGADLLSEYRLGGLVDIVPVISLIIATGFTLDAQTCFGYPDPIGAEGLVDADFVLADAAGGPIAITSVTPQVTDSTKYDFLFASTPAETITLSRTAAMLIKGFDMADELITTP